MPFTLSHAAAALPFRRTRLVISAVVIGSFAPDFEYFIPFWHHGAFGHTLPGIFLFDLPVALLVLWAFHAFAKEPLAACLPRRARERLKIGPRSLSVTSVSHLGLILVSILVGIATHIAWDSFTHPDYWLYYHWHALRETVHLPLFGRRPWYAILQYLSSAFGILFILVWFVHWYRSTPPSHPQSDVPSPTGDRIVLAAALAIALAAALVRAAGFGIPDGVRGSQRFMAVGAITAITVFWIELLIYGIVRNHRRSGIKTT